MSTLKGLIGFVVLAAVGTLLVRLGLDAETREVVSLPWVVLGSSVLALSGAVLLVLLARGSLLLIDMVLFPGESGGPPPALYKLAEWYMAEGRYADALAEYEKISKSHPRELECWTGMLDVVAGAMGDVKRAQAVARKGIRRLRDAGKRVALQAHYQQLTGKRWRESWWF